MKFTDNYTLESVEISVLDKNGKELINDLVEASPAFANGFIKVDDNNKQYVLSEELINWWKKFAADLNADIAEIVSLEKIYGEEAVTKILDEEFDDSSYASSHMSNQKAFARIKAELKPIK